MKKIVASLVFILCYFSALPSIDASTAYPLQSKHPDKMIYKANTNQKVIALTFDDGPDRRFTPQILDVLNKHHVKGTFFLLGTRVEKYPDVAKRIQNEGHVIGNHTYWHPELTKTSVKNMKWEVKKNEEAIQSITNFKTQLFRAPYGALDDDLVDELSKMGYRGVGWSIDTEDWKSLSSKEIKQNILNDIHPGAIILMHSAGHWTQDLSGTAEALDEVIPYLRKKGYEFVTIPELWAM
ncbi:polysaccharide deacetylase family protein [Pueribacillus theae]|nr:polysaccharide deacetylase family protein [Pueribacillus theae]